MKVYDFGNDYAFQQKQKSIDSAPIKQENPVTNDQNQVQTGGGSEMESTNTAIQNAETTSQTENSESPKKKKTSTKKSETEIY